MDTIQAHFENEAKAYDDNIQKLIPYYNQMIEALVWTIPFERQKKIRVIDLGCGTGTVAKCIKDAFPDAHITCLDFTENMLKLSKMKLGNQPNFRFEASDFNHYQFHSTYDVIVSSLALLHLESDQDKICFYQKIYNCLAKEGVFYNKDLK